MQYGMPTLIEHESLEESARLCRRLGLRFIELNMNLPAYQTESLADVEALSRVAGEYGIYYTIHLDENLDFASYNTLVAQAWQESVRKTIRAVKKLLPLRDLFGDPSQPLILNMHMNHGVHFTLPDRREVLYGRDEARYLEACRRFRELCVACIGGEDLMIAVENTDGYWPWEQRGIDLMLESPRFGLTWDIGHSRAAGDEDVTFLLARQDRLVHFHIHDATAAPPRDHLALGDGDLNLKGRLRLAAACGARCVIETKTAAALEKSVEWLRQRGLMGPNEGFPDE